MAVLPRIILISLSSIAAVIVTFYFIQKTHLANSPREHTISPATQSSNATDPEAALKFHKLYTQLTAQQFSSDSIKTQIAQFPEASVEKIVLESVQLRRQSDYAGMYHKLTEAFSPTLVLHEYYDELVFAASATGNSSSVEKLVLANGNGNAAQQMLYFRGAVHQAASRFDSASVFYEKYLQHDSTSAAAALRLVTCYINIGKMDQAAKILSRYKTNIELTQSTYTESLLLRGLAAYYQADFPKAKAFYSDALALAQKAQLVNYESRALVNLGILKDQEGDLTSARNLYRSAEAKAQKINDPFGSGLASGELGVSYSYANEISGALAEYKNALKYFSLINNRFRLSLLYANIGNIYMTIGDLPAAKSSFEKGQNLSQNSPRAYCLNSIGLGDVYTNTGNYTEAIKLYEKAQALLQSAKMYDLRSAVNLSLSALSYSVGRYQASVQICNESLSRAESEANSPQDIAKLYRQTGLSYYGLDSLPQALAYLVKAQKIAEQYGLAADRYRILLDIAGLQIENGKLREAAVCLSAAGKSLSSMSVSEQISYYTANLSYATETHNFLSCGKFIAAGERIFGQCTHPETKANFLFESANYYRKINDAEKASAAYIAATSLLENVASSLLSYQKLHISRRAAVYDLYRKVIDYFIEQGKYETAFTILDHARAKNSFYAINEKAFENANFSKDDFEKYQELGWMIESGLYTRVQVDSLLSQRHALELKGQLSGFFQDAGYIQSPKSYLAALQTKLDDHSYIVSLFTQETKSWFFIVSQKGFAAIDVPAGKQEAKDLLSQVSLRFAKDTKKQVQINSDLFAFHAGKANQLYEKFFKPAFALIPENAEIVFVPSEEFYSFPLELLVKSFDTNESPYKYAGVDYLVNHYTLSSAPSAEIYTRLMQRDRKETANALIMGNPSFGTNVGLFAERRGLFDETPGMPRNLTLYPLKYSEDEIESIRDNFSNVSFYNGRNATETNFKLSAGKSGIIHLSTHSWLIGKQPAIFFSSINDTLNDGILEAGEVAQMNLHADLVALSSCNSGEGIHEASEGVVGMTKAFLDAGAASVVVSMWEVNDHYTAEFMKLFYASLRSGKSKADALREAKLSFIASVSSNPYYWSGFVLVGNTGMLPSNYTRPFPLSTGYILGLLALLGLATGAIYRKRRIAVKA